MTMTTELLRTPLHDWHVRHGGRMVDFAGWSMPVQYTSIAEEHNATRNAVGMFDISHMGRLFFRGQDTAAFLDALVTRRVVDMRPFQIRYSLACNDAGGILDDVLVYRLDSANPFVVVVNASNRTKIIGWLEKQLENWSTGMPDVSVSDATTQTAMIAVQGPKALEVLQPIVNSKWGRPAWDLSGMRYYHATINKTHDVIISRTGYTGEDGFEIICEVDFVPLWEQLISAAEAVGGKAAGLGARDTLRLEAAMPLYGHELSETISPIQAGLNFAVNLGGRKFVGSEALERFAADKSQPVRIGLQCDGKRVPRQGCPVLYNNEIVGEVTSGTYSPTLDRPIAMAYVQPAASAIGTQLTTDIRGTQHPAVVVPLPFYQREKKN